jgi:Type ISP C-terminal specificity domain
MQKYFDPRISHEEMSRIAPEAMEASARFESTKVREYLCTRGFLPEKIIRYAYRPFDVRWLYWEPETKLIDRNRAEYFPQVFDGNFWLSAGQRNRKEIFYQPQFTTVLADHHIVESNVGMFPLYLCSNQKRTGLFDDENQEVRANLTVKATAYLSSHVAEDSHLFYHTIAILHAPLYSRENAGALRQDWPRVPLTNTKQTLETSACLGQEVGGLLDTETPVAGVTTGTIRQELKTIAVISRRGGGILNPDAGDLALTAGWGHAGKGGITMPGKGQLDEREYTQAELDAISAGVEAIGLSTEQALAHIGETTFDIYLNDVACWRNVPARVWDYTIGGYQVIKKWLSYRDRELLGRALTPDEARELRNIARRISGIRLLELALDENYERVKHATFPWPT